MSWYKFSKQNRGEVIDNIKKILSTHPFFTSLLEEYHIPISDVQSNLKIVFTDLKDRFAEGDGKEIRINKKLLDCDNFIKENMHFVAHEFFHWIKRRSEQLFYFNDPEEIQSFVLGMAWELIQGKAEDHLERVIFPIIAGHFASESEARLMWMQMLEEAYEIAEGYNA